MYIIVSLLCLFHWYFQTILWHHFPHCMLCLKYIISTLLRIHKFSQMVSVIMKYFTESWWIIVLEIIRNHVYKNQFSWHEKINIFICCWLLVDLIKDERGTLLFISIENILVSDERVFYWYIQEIIWEIDKRYEVF